MSEFIVLLGPPGAGKGTQAKRMTQSLGLPHISSGDIFRHHLRQDSELGRAAKKYMDRGDLVPDEITIAMIKERLGQPDCSRGAILDGFPRTPAQAEGLDEMLKGLGGRVVAVLYVQISEDTLIRRLTGRLMCRKEGHTYHKVFNPPQKPGVCDVDGSELYRRDDDQVDTVRSRVRVYYEQTTPLIEHYRQRGLLIEVDGEGSIEAVSQSLLAAIPQGTGA